MDNETLTKILNEHGFGDFKWLRGGQVATARWVRMKCVYGCPHYGTRGSCPPEVPSLEESREFFSEYENIAVIRISVRTEDIGDHREWSRETNRRLLELERGVFLAGFHKAFVMYVDGNCVCEECAVDRKSCTDKAAARPSPEAMGVDVFSTARNCGYPIEVIPGETGTMNRYALLLVS